MQTICELVYPYLSTQDLCSMRAVNHETDNVLMYPFCKLLPMYKVYQVSPGMFEWMLDGRSVDSRCFEVVMEDRNAAMMQVLVDKSLHIGVDQFGSPIDGVYPVDLVAFDTPFALGLIDMGYTLSNCAMAQLLANDMLEEFHLFRRNGITFDTDFATVCRLIVSDRIDYLDPKTVQRNMKRFTPSQRLILKHYYTMLPKWKDNIQTLLIA